MFTTSKLHTDRRCNPYKDLYVDGHKRKDLRCVFKTVKRKFPFLLPNAKICWKCRCCNNEHYDSIDSESSQNILGNRQGDICMNYNSSINMDYDSSNLDVALPLLAEAFMVRAKREIQ